MIPRPLERTAVPFFPPLVLFPTRGIAVQGLRSPPKYRPTNRRLFLRSIAASSIGVAAGCLDTLSSGDEGANNSDGSERERIDGAVLEPPERDLSEASHPSYGDEFPAVELPNPLNGETVSTDQFKNDRTVLMTFFYTS
ncbi:hypothetical protein Htur_4289 (plasmid) [Haloterrigena turkmenica DSM 5511]|uniref:Uncharacterized protein n=1 Tax=Haloterrigena turkmenica (strain ATCC 51198 / DSM 5511 / JCM 9101 / NCIMB 13204 / VKM B-1734 / 4k) TaxID=543526 RepID=D2S159_HALTV|nr:hypothetical protein Htur_4289 [Haloterrigena turkmenica DSM 5511]